jgi:hypothetical protein
MSLVEDDQPLAPGRHRRQLCADSRQIIRVGCLPESDQAVTEPQQTRDFFAQGQTFYRYNIQGMRARDIVHAAGRVPTLTTAG